MKTLILKLSLVVILFVGAISLSSAQTFEKRQVSNFSNIVCDGPFTVHISLDGTESLKISTQPDDSGVINLIQTSVEKGILTLKYKDDLKSGEGNTSGPVDIYISAKSLTSLALNGSGTMTVDKGILSGNVINITLNGSGNISSPIISKKLSVAMSSSGIVALKGNTDKAFISINGSGMLKSSPLDIKDASVSINLSGTAYFKADNSILAQVNGSGGIYYSGNPLVTGNGASKAE